MDIFDAYQMDDSAVTDGVWAELVLLGNRVGGLKVRPSDGDLNLDYRKGLTKAAEALLKMKTKEGEIDVDKSVEMTARLYADTIITDWELYTKGPDGEDVAIEFSKEKCVELLIKLPKLLKAAQDAAKGWTQFRRSALAEAKND